jgi:hypothetical protein
MLFLLLLLIVIGQVTDVFIDKKNDKGDDNAFTAVNSGPWDPYTHLYKMKSAISWVSEPLNFMELVSHQACN